MAIELALEALKEGEGVRRTAGKASEDLALMEPAYLACVTFHDRIPEGHLAVAGHGNGGAPAHGQNGGSVELFHSDPCIAGAWRP